MKGGVNTMTAIKNPKQCPDCASTNITPVGSTTFPLSAEGKIEQSVALVFKCNDCDNLTFKSAN